MSEPVGRQVGTAVGVRRGWPLPVRLILLAVVAGALGLVMLSAGGDDDGSGSAADDIAELGPADDPSAPAAGATGSGDDVDATDRLESGSPGDAAIASPSGGAGPVGGLGGTSDETEPVIEPDPGLVTRLVEGAAACEDPASGPPLVVGVAADDGAVTAGRAALEVVAARHLADLVNCVGGASGRPVEVASVDPGGSPLAARRGVEDLLAVGPVAIVGPRSTDVGLRVLEAVDGRLPVLFPLTVEPALDDPRRSGFLLGPDGAALARVAALFALEQGWDTAVTFSAPGPGPTLGPVVFAEAFEAGGGTAGLDLPYADGVTADFADQVARLEGPLPQDEPAVIFTAMAPGQLSVLQAELRQARIGSAVLTVDGRAPIDGAGAPAAGTLMVGRTPEGDVDRVEWFDDSFRDASGEGFDDAMAAARVADALLVLIAAIERVGQEPGDLAPLLAAGTLIEGVSGVVGTGPPATRPESIPVVELTDDGPVLVADLPG